MQKNGGELQRDDLKLLQWEAEEKLLNFYFACCALVVMAPVVFLEFFLK